MARGRVKWFDEQKGYGFITCEQGDVFVHHTGIAGKGFTILAQDEEVEFDLVEMERGAKAENVTRVSSSSGS